MVELGGILDCQVTKRDTYCHGSMANVFLSYAREDGAKAALIARALTRQGWKVWWDRTIPPGRTFDDVIEDALEDASCVVVLWSKSAITSHWVRAEAAEGMRRGILVPAFLENVKIPLEFRRIQAANLTSWNGSVGDPKFDQFLQSVAMLMQPTTIGPTPVAVASLPAVEPSFDSFERTPVLQAPPAMPHRPRIAVWTIALAIIAAAITGVLAWWIMPASPAGVSGTERKQIDKAPVAPPPQASVPAPQSDPRRDVPMVVGKTLVEAHAQLERIGLVVGDVRQTAGGGPVGTITAQRPVAGERVGPGTTIDLEVAAAAATKPEIVRQPPKSKAETTVVPDAVVPALTGLASEVARDRIVRRGFSVGRVSVRPASKAETDLVLAQDPAPGTRQRPGTAVSLVIGGEP
jgi:hypothetical protein